MAWDRVLILTRSFPARLRRPALPVANSQGTIHFFYQTITSRFRTELDAVDVIVDGSLFALPGSDVSIAIGGQYRREAWTADFAESLEMETPPMVRCVPTSLRTRNSGTCARTGAVSHPSRSQTAIRLHRAAVARLPPHDKSAAEVLRL